MASIQKRGSSYRARITREGKSTLSATFPTKAEALAWASEIQAKIRLGIYHDESELRPIQESDFEEAANHYIQTHSIYKKSGHSEIGIIRILIKRWATLDVAEINKFHVLALRDELLSLGRAGSTINHYFNAISKIYQMLTEEWGMLVTNPIKGIKRIPNSKGRSVRVNRDIESQLLAGCQAIDTPLLASIIKFAIQTGMRRGEVMGLDWADVDIANRKAYLHKTKNGETRQVPLTLRAIEVLRALPKTEERVFPMTFDCLRSQFKRLRSYLKQGWDGYGANPFKDLRFHDFWHEALSRLSDAGLNVIELSHISGHKTLAMLKRYTHPSHEAIFLKIDKNLSL
ncbi:site-specific integrase [Polynucleobacter sp. HIN8]|uniref:tyrosine-type recombinase/integrase n=1 Tax=Polynucleobacter sp. HIN8 TaxID=3047867 RepID=UPI002573EB63|nr:site-specific integrase [Polynucleobacter sp. HIN8]BEI39324.1 site-specific integrase [Polynucleobacter sp. HIN8]